MKIMFNYWLIFIYFWLLDLIFFPFTEIEGCCGFVQEYNIGNIALSSTNQIADCLYVRDKSRITFSCSKLSVLETINGKNGFSITTPAFIFKEVTRMTYARRALYHVK